MPLAISVSAPHATGFPLAQPHAAAWNAESAAILYWILVIEIIRLSRVLTFFEPGMAMIRPAHVVQIPLRQEQGTSHSFS